jgi:hypothetical protein
VNQAGTQIALAATVFWLKQSTDSRSLVGLMTAITTFRMLLLSSLGGRGGRSVFPAQHPDRLRFAVRSCFVQAGLASPLALSPAGGVDGWSIPGKSDVVTVAATQVGSAVAFEQASGFLAVIWGSFSEGCC